MALDPQQRKRSLISGITALSLALAGSAGTASAAPVLMPSAPPLPDAKSYILMDFQTGQIIAEKNPNLQLPPASLTKLMTAYLAYGALANGTLHWNQRIHVSRVAWHTGGSSLFIQPNLPVTVDQLMHGLIIDSGNDAAVALAQAIAGSQAALVNEMNATALKLGLHGTHYSDVDGLPTPDLHTSALDVALISRDLIKKYPQIIVTAQVGRSGWQDKQDCHGAGTLRDGYVIKPHIQPTATHGYVVLATGTNGLPANTRRIASIAPKAFLRAVEI